MAKKKTVAKKPGTLAERIAVRLMKSDFRYRWCKDDWGFCQTCLSRMIEEISKELKAKPKAKARSK